MKTAAALPCGFQVRGLDPSLVPVMVRDRPRADSFWEQSCPGLGWGLEGSVWCWGTTPPMPLTGPTPMPLSHLSKNLEMSVIRHRLKAICLWTKCHLILSSRVQPSPSLPPWGPPPSTRHCFPRADTQPMSSVSRASLTHDALTRTPSSQPSVKILLSSCSLFPVSLGSSFTFTKFKVI